MRLPQPLIESPFFSATDADEVLAALGTSAEIGEDAELRRLSELGLPPITSVNALSVMIGVNNGLIWSFINRPARHYRIFTLAKGKGERTISAPRVGLKIVQTWIAYHLSRSVKLPPHVFGFVPGRSHIDAAFEHRGAEWAYSVDIENFFGTTPQSLVVKGLTTIGFLESSSQLVAALSSLNRHLTQGSPASPVLSNIAFLQADKELDAVARRFDATLTRYADDIVFSGSGALPDGLIHAVQSLFVGLPWSLAQHKSRIEPLNGRIKVHGLIVNGDRVRLTKGYRNKLRAYRHIISRNEDVQHARQLAGHLNYAQHVSARLESLAVNPASIRDYQYYESPIIVAADTKQEATKKSLFVRLLDRIRNALL